MNKESKKIFAIVGMAGSGKSEAVDYLCGKFEWPKVYFGEVVFDEIRARELEENQENERMVRESLREENGMGVCADRSLPKIEKYLEKSEVVIVESLYSWDEYKILKRKFTDFFKVIAIHSSPAVRFSRIRNRKERALMRYEELEKRDWTEIENIDKGGPIAIADEMVINEGSLQDLHGKLDDLMADEGFLERDFADNV